MDAKMKKLLEKQKQERLYMEREIEITNMVEPLLPAWVDNDNWLVYEKQTFNNVDGGLGFKTYGVNWRSGFAHEQITDLMRVLPPMDLCKLKIPRYSAYYVMKERIEQHKDFETEGVNISDLTPYWFKGNASYELYGNKIVAVKHNSGEVCWYTKLPDGSCVSVSATLSGVRFNTRRNAYRQILCDVDFGVPGAFATGVVDRQIGSVSVKFAFPGERYCSDGVNYDGEYIYAWGDNWMFEGEYDD